MDDMVQGEAEALVTNAERLWMMCAEALRSQVSEATWKTWFDGVRAIDADDDHLVLAVPNSLVKERIEHRYLPLVRDVLADDIYGGGASVRARPAPAVADLDASSDRHPRA